VRASINLNDTILFLRVEWSAEKPVQVAQLKLLHRGRFLEGDVTLEGMRAIFDGVECHYDAVASSSGLASRTSAP
jgi:hypothetical protein